jgi:hypothetical protein
LKVIRTYKEKKVPGSSLPDLMKGERPGAFFFSPVRKVFGFGKALGFSGYAFTLQNQRR